MALMQATLFLTNFRIKSVVIRATSNIRVIRVLLFSVVGLITN